MKSLLTESEAASQLSLSLRTLQSHRKLGKGPEFIKNGRSYFYDPEKLRSWIEAQSTRAATWRFATQNISIPQFFGLEVDDDHRGPWSLELKGCLAIEIQEDGQVWMGFESDDSQTSLTFECFGFRVQGSSLWSTGDVTIAQVGGEDDSAS
ncbi:helix-turn-helix domain-containing protein [Maricaulis maris]|uniref:helix-turn-helix domain-containing protein n=1 Tax=Maricaulis maris TaxID=74318 RepID=UPI002920601B|nr:hypothetical protein MACH15_01640 [Maricaulis maris]